MPTSLMTQQNSAELQVAVQSNNDMQVTLSDVQEIVAKSFLDRNIAVPISFGHLLSLLRIIAAASMQYNQILMSKMLEKIDLANQLQSFQNAMNDFASLLPLIISDSSIPWSDQKSDNMDTIFDYILNKYPSSPDCINFKNKISSILTKYGYDINSISKSGGNSVFTDAILRDVFGKLNSKLNKYNMNIPLQLPTDTINHAPTSKSDFQNYANQAKDLMDNVTSIENEDKSNVSSYQDIMRSMLGFLNDWYNSYSMLVRG